MHSKDSFSFHQIDENSIHLWSINPQSITDNSKLAYFMKIVSSEELKKIQQYKNEKDRHNALVTRAFIRLILSSYVDISPQDWSFSKNEHGKPQVTQNSILLRFNLSHNNDLIICAICLDQEIGCDIERYDRKVNISAISKRFYSKHEHAYLNKLCESEKQKQFIQLWTLKEAFVKATGYGISLGLNTFSFIIGESDSPLQNSNIDLTISNKCKAASNLNWFNCLLFTDSKYCIALSVNSKQLTSNFKIQHLHSDDLIHSN